MFAIRFFQLRLNTVFGVKENHMHLEAFTALRKVLILPLNDQIERRGKQLGHVTS